MKIALVGGYQRTRMWAPFDDPGWEIWATAIANVGVLPRHDAWFEIHPLLPLLDRGGQVYVDWLAGLPRVYMQRQSSEYPGSVAYPADAMLRSFGRYFFTSTAAWMIALALSLDPETIGLWGFEMASGAEYAKQRPGLHHFVQIARDRGIGIVVPAGSTLLDPGPLYGEMEAMI